MHHWITNCDKLIAELGVTFPLNISIRRPSRNERQNRVWVLQFLLSLVCCQIYHQNVKNKHWTLVTLLHYITTRQGRITPGWKNLIIILSGTKTAELFPVNASVDSRWRWSVVGAIVGWRQRLVQIVSSAKRSRSHHVQYHSENHEDHHHEEIVSDALIRTVGQIDALIVCAVRLAVAKQRQQPTHRDLMAPDAFTSIEFVAHGDDVADCSYVSKRKKEANCKEVRQFAQRT